MCPMAYASNLGSPSCLARSSRVGKPMSDAFSAHVIHRSLACDHSRGVPAFSKVGKDLNSGKQDGRQAVRQARHNASKEARKQARTQANWHTSWL